MKSVLFCDRDNFEADADFREDLIRVFREHGIGVTVYGPPYRPLRDQPIVDRYREALGAFDPEKKLEKLNCCFRQILKGLFLLKHPSLWRYPIARRKMTSMAFLARQLARAISGIDPTPSFIIGRSAGARIASLTADQLKLDGLICLGYPFKHPDKGDEPARYAHLANLKTPCLIIQGDQDVYGGLDVLGRYKLSSSITMKFIRTDHDFKMPDADWKGVLDCMIEFINGTPRVAELGTSRAKVTIP